MPEFPVTYTECASGPAKVDRCAPELTWRRRRRISSISGTVDERFSPSKKLRERKEKFSFEESAPCNHFSLFSGAIWSLSPPETSDATIAIDAQIYGQLFRTR
jgi:hypothetical protein